jgi:hypothetical protein
MLKHASLLPSSPQTKEALNAISEKQLKILSWTPFVNINIGTKEMLKYNLSPLQS